MRKYHINKNGVPAICRAKGKCPLGGENEHYDTKEEALRAADLKNSEEYGIFPEKEFMSKVKKESKDFEEFIQERSINSLIKEANLGTKSSMISLYSEIDNHESILLIGEKRVSGQIYLYAVIGDDRTNETRTYHLGKYDKKEDALKSKIQYEELSKNINIGSTVTMRRNSDEEKRQEAKLDIFMQKKGLEKLSYKMNSRDKTKVANLFSKLEESNKIIDFGETKVGNLTYIYATLENTATKEQSIQNLGGFSREIDSKRVRVLLEEFAKEYQR